MNGEDKKGKRGLVLALLLAFLLVIGGLAYYLSPPERGVKAMVQSLLGKGEEAPVLNMSITRDLGAVKARGEGLPGFDIDRDGEADYLTQGFGYYKGIYGSGGFEYLGGELELEEFGVNISLPAMKLEPDELIESSVGSVVSFAGENGSVSVTVSYKTLGPALTTYNLFIQQAGGESYYIIDRIDRNGSGVIEEREVNLPGHVVFRE